jgi:signal transduction histidine kinase
MFSGFRRSRIGSTILFRIAAGYSALMVASVVALGAVAYLFLSTTLANHDRALVRAELDGLANDYRSGGVPALSQAVERNDSHNKNYPFFVRLLDGDGRTLRTFFPQYWSDFDLAALERAPLRAGAWGSFRSRDGANELEHVSVELPGAVRLQVGISTQERGAVLRRLRETFLLASIPLLALGLSGGAVLAQRSLRPIRQLVHALAEIQAGRLDARAPRTRSGDELDELGRLFNEMLERIQSLVRGMRDALDAVAHDLRTPMTRFRAGAEEALRRGDPDGHAAALETCLEESDQILRMLNVLMDVSEAENGVMSLRRREVDASALATNVAEMYRYVGEEKGVELVTDIAPAVRASLDPERTSQALANLLDNAVKYTPAGGRVELRLAAGASGLSIDVADTGIGIDAAEHDRIWDRLYRGRHDNTRGIGLGLSLVRAVVRAHGGEVAARNRPEGGAVFEVRLPPGTPGPRR